MLTLTVILQIKIPHFLLSIIWFYLTFPPTIQTPKEVVGSLVKLTFTCLPHPTSKMENY